MNTEDEVELLRFQNKYLAETVLLMVQDLTRAGMAEFDPPHSEMLDLANWAYGLLEKVGVDFSKLEVYQEEV